MLSDEGPTLSGVGLTFSDEGPMLEMLDFTIRIGSTPTFLYFDLYLNYEQLLEPPTIVDS